MAAALALVGAIVYGVADFCGGLASKRGSATASVLWSHAVGLLLVLASLPLIDGELRGGDLVIGAIGGIAGVAGVGLLYQALSIGPMSVVAPITALLAAAVPVVAGLVEGDRPDLAVAGGMALALAAIVLVSAEGGGSLRPNDLRGVTFALGAGVGFGLFFIAMSHTGDDAGTWPLLAARCTSVALMGSLALLGRVERTVPADARILTAVAGALDVTANLLYLLAVREGLLSVVAVLISLYPVSTVVLARVVLRERFIPLQRVGMALAIPAAILLAT
jgi:drug/metabolite transporter (DMT)-like permease